MNTQTVLTIIEMINAKLISLKKAMLEEKLKKLEEQENAPVFISIDISAPAEYFHRRDKLTELRDYLQSFIEETEFPDPKSACPACGSHDPDHLCQL